MPRHKPETHERRERYANWLLLQQSFVRRSATYIEEISGLIGAGSTQPREWLERYGNFWSGVIDDVGDWLQHLAGNPLRPSTEWIQRVHIKLQQRVRCTSIPIDVPLEAFRGQQSIDKPLTLKVGGLLRAGKGEPLVVKHNLRFSNDRVWVGDRRRSLKVFDLPPLRVGDIYSGIVWAQETKKAVVAIELTIV